MDLLLLADMTTVAFCGVIDAVDVVNRDFVVATATPEEVLKDVGFATVPA